MVSVNPTPSTKNEFCKSKNEFELQTGSKKIALLYFWFSTKLSSIKNEKRVTPHFNVKIII